MTQRICQRFTRGERWVERFVDTLNSIRFEATGDRQRIAQEAFGIRKKRKCVAVELTVVKKLGAVGSAESSDPKQALGHLELQPFGFAEQDCRRPKKHPVAEHAEAAQQVLGIPITGLVQPPDPYRLRNGVANFSGIQIVDFPSVRRLVSHRCSLCMRSKSMR